MKTIRQNEISFLTKHICATLGNKYTKKLIKYIVDITTQYIYYQQKIYASVLSNRE